MANNVPAQPPVAAVPDMHAEPAVTIGDVFANKILLKAFITAAIAVAAKIWNLSSDDETVTQITDLIFYGFAIITPFMAQFENRQRAQEQALTTRSAVYSPASVEREQTKAYDAGLPPVEPKPDLPPPNDEGLRALPDDPNL